MMDGCVGVGERELLPFDDSGVNFESGRSFMSPLRLGPVTNDSILAPLRAAFAIFRAGETPSPRPTVLEVAREDVDNPLRIEAVSRVGVVPRLTGRWRLRTLTRILLAASSASTRDVCGYAEVGRRRFGVVVLALCLGEFT